MSLMKSDNKNQREREREKERIPRRISVLLKSRPCFVEPKKTKKQSSSLSRNRHFNYFLEDGRKKMSHTK